MKNDEFHVPFIKNLVFIGLITVVSMISVRLFLHSFNHTSIDTPVYASQKSYTSQ